MRSVVIVTVLALTVVMPAPAQAPVAFEDVPPWRLRSCGRIEALRKAARRCASMCSATGPAGCG